VCDAPSAAAYTWSCCAEDTGFFVQKKKRELGVNSERCSVVLHQNAEKANASVCVQHGRAGFQRWLRRQRRSTSPREKKKTLKAMSVAVHVLAGRFAPLSVCLCVRVFDQ
jgi:hypothetical protein